MMPNIGSTPGYSTVHSGGMHFPSILVQLGNQIFLYCHSQGLNTAWANTKHKASSYPPLVSSTKLIRLTIGLSSRVTVTSNIFTRCDLSKHFDPKFGKHLIICLNQSSCRKALCLTLNMGLSVFLNQGLEHMLNQKDLRSLLDINETTAVLEVKCLLKGLTGHIYSANFLGEEGGGKFLQHEILPCLIAACQN